MFKKHKLCVSFLRCRLVHFYYYVKNIIVRISNLLSLQAKHLTRVKMFQYLLQGNRYQRAWHHWRECLYSEAAAHRNPATKCSVIRARRNERAVYSSVQKICDADQHVTVKTRFEERLLPDHCHPQQRRLRVLREKWLRLALQIFLSMSRRWQSVIATKTFKSWNTFEILRTITKIVPWSIVDKVSVYYVHFGFCFVRLEELEKKLPSLTFHEIEKVRRRRSAEVDWSQWCRRFDLLLSWKKILDNPKNGRSSCNKQ